jgi:uncharacterized protein (DUF488 family)
MKAPASRRVDRTGGTRIRTKTVFSIGYEKRSMVSLVTELRANGVRRLLDVREIALSRRVEFRKAALERGLAAAGIRYRHVPEAGNPYRDEEDRKRCLASYRRYLRRHPEIVSAVAAAIGAGRVALFCYERAHGECHRSVLFAALSERVAGMKVVQLE